MLRIDHTLATMQREIDDHNTKWLPLHKCDTMDDAPLHVQLSHYKDLARVYYNIHVRQAETVRELRDSTTTAWRVFDWSRPSRNGDDTRRFFVGYALVTCMRCGDRFTCGGNDHWFPYCVCCEQLDHHTKRHKQQ